MLFVFYDSKRSVSFLEVFFLPEVLFVQTAFRVESEIE